ncbi:YceI family protein [Nonomuraea sp. NN258]|uniref:YceI family protein n=1 Tax=Nonomuraea antri TaxID=2730852 RepID=UPI001569863E|nr:YceI family protein [Nonomuraea antri]NRQ33111.1 YceI family protein [Nonomuraea antri]
MTELSTAASLTERLIGNRLWHLDPWHTGVHFRAVHRGAGWVRGRFTRVNGTIAFPDGIERPRVTVHVDLDGIGTGVPARDAHLRSADYLDTGAFPRMRLSADRLERTGETAGVLHGELDLHGFVRPIELETRWRGAAPDPLSEEEHLAFTATGEISLGGFGIRPPVLPGLRLPTVGDRVAIELDVVLLPYDPAPLLADIPVT